MSYLDDKTYDDLMVLALKGILVRESADDLGFSKEAYKTHEEHVAQLVDTGIDLDSSVYDSEVSDILKEQFLDGSRQLADIYQSSQTLTIPQVVEACDYFFRKYNRDFDRRGRKRSFPKRALRGAVFNKNKEYDPDRVENSINAIRNNLGRMFMVLVSGYLSPLEL